jgi:Ca2+-binding RTX toxin-like protein
MELESLDGRRLFNATVTEGYPGFYEIQGDDSANVIDVSVSMQDHTFTLDGQTYAGVVYIFVEGQDNNDTISVTSTDGPGSIGATIVSRGGDDDVSLNFDGAVWAGDGNDTLHLSDSFRGQAYGQEGNDRISISGDCLDPAIDGGEGDDVIDCSGNHYGVIVHGGSGNDTIHGTPYDDQIYGDEGCDTFYGEGGRDTYDADANDHIVYSEQSGDLGYDQGDTLPG